MSLALNKPKLDNLAGDIWKSAERLRGKFKGYEYQGVILPITEPSSPRGYGRPGADERRAGGCPSPPGSLRSTRTS